MNTPERSHAGIDVAVDGDDVNAQPNRHQCTGAPGALMRKSVTATAMLLTAGFCLSACSTCVRGVKDVMDRGDEVHGFCAATVMRPSRSEFESIGYFGHCFYRGRDLGPCGELAVSPDGRYAAWVDSSTARVKAFAPGWSDPRWITYERNTKISRLAVTDDPAQVHVFTEGAIAPSSIDIPRSD